MIKPANRRELVELLTGFALLALGIGLNLFSFSIAAAIVANPAGFVESWIPSQETPLGPHASFMFTVEGLVVTFQDGSQAGDSPISGYSWDFGDGERSNAQNPQHTYGINFRGVVRLTAVDTAGRESNAIANVDAAPGIQLQGNSMTDPADIANGIGGNPTAGLVGAFVGLASVVAVFAMLLIMWLVGASITKAGWNLVKPKTETIRVRIKPKHLEAEPLYAEPPGIGLNQPLSPRPVPPPPPA